MEKNKNKKNIKKVSLRWWAIEEGQALEWNGNEGSIVEALARATD